MVISSECLATDHFLASHCRTHHRLLWLLFHPRGFLTPGPRLLFPSQCTGQTQSPQDHTYEASLAKSSSIHPSDPRFPSRGSWQATYLLHLEVGVGLMICRPLFVLSSPGRSPRSKRRRWRRWRRWPGVCRAGGAVSFLFFHVLRVSGPAITTESIAATTYDEWCEQQKHARKADAGIIVASQSTPS